MPSACVNLGILSASALIREEFRVILIVANNA
jgi:hypothetical protein